MRFRSTLAVLGLVTAVGASVLPRFTSAQEVNCANEFRSGKLYFAQKIYRKAVGHFALAVKTCPDKAEYRAVKFLRDDPDDQLAYSSSVRFFQEALSLQNKSDNIDSLVRFLGWGAVARDLTRRGPVN